MVLIELTQDDERRSKLHKLYTNNMSEGRIDRLIEIAGQYDYNRKTGKDGPCRNAARTNLEEALLHLDGSEDIIKLNRVAESEFFDALITLPPETFGSYKSVSRIGDYFNGKLSKHILETTLNVALKRLKSKRGASLNIAAYEVVDSLCKLYEDVFDKLVTHFVKKHNKSGAHSADTDRSPKSEAGRFVLEALRIIDPGFPDYKVSTCLESYIRRQNAKSQAV